MSIEKWDEYFHNMCIAVSKNSKCLSRQIGSVLVRDKSIISTGYNGPSIGVPHCGDRHKYDIKLLGEYKRIDPHFDEFITTTKCPRQILGFKSGEGLDWCVAGHSERNSLINAAKNGISTKGTSLYMDCGVPCTPCLVEIINAGVSEIIITKFSYYDLSSEYLLKNSNLLCRVFSHIKQPGIGKY